MTRLSIHKDNTDLENYKAIKKASREAYNSEQEYLFKKRNLSK
jgi:hypothetical protein